LGDAELPGLGETASVLLGGMELQLPRICQHCYSVYCAPLAVEAREASAAFEPRDTKPSVVRPELAAPPSAHFALEWPEWTNGPRRMVWTARDGTEFTCGGEVPGGLLRIGSNEQWVQVDLAPLRDFVNSCLGSPAPTLLDRLLLEMRRTFALARRATPGVAHQAELADGFVRLWDLARLVPAAPERPDAVRDTAALYDTDVSPGEEERRRRVASEAAPSQFERLRKLALTPPNAFFEGMWRQALLEILDSPAPSRERDWCPSCQKTADLEPCKGEDGFVYWGCRQCGHPRSTPTGPGRAVRVEHGLPCQLVEMGPEVFWADEQTRRWLIEEDDARGVPATEQHLAGLLLVLARKVADRNQWVGLRTTIEQALVHVHFADRAEEGKEYPS
jgi:hypothetical protein